MKKDKRVSDMAAGARRIRLRVLQELEARGAALDSMSMADDAGAPAWERAAHRRAIGSMCFFVRNMR